MIWATYHDIDVSFCLIIKFVAIFSRPKYSNFCLSATIWKKTFITKEPYDTKGHLEPVIQARIYEQAPFWKSMKMKSDKVWHLAFILHVEWDQSDKNLEFGGNSKIFLHIYKIGPRPVILVQICPNLAHLLNLHWNCAKYVILGIFRETMYRREDDFGSQDGNWKCS